MALMFLTLPCSLALSAPPSQLIFVSKCNSILPRPAAFAIFQPRIHANFRPALRVKASSSELVGTGDWGEPVSLGTVKLPANVNLLKLETLLFQWGSSLTQNANLPLPVPLKVDKISGGIRLGYIKVTDGAIEELVHIDCLVSQATTDSNPMFRAVRSGRFKDQVPPGEPAIMQSLLQALRKSIELSTV